MTPNVPHTLPALSVPPASSAPAAPFAPSASSALVAPSAAPSAAPAPGSPLWLAFCVLACSAFAALLGRLAHFPQSSSLHSPDTPDDLSADHSFAILLRLIAIDWFRRFQHAPATPEQLLRRSRVAQAIFSQPLAPIVACDLPGETPAAGVFAPAFAGQLAAASSTPLALTPTSFLNAYFATLSRPARSSRNQALLNDKASPDAVDTLFITYSLFVHSALRIRHSALDHSAFPRAPV